MDREHLDHFRQKLLAARAELQEEFDGLPVRTAAEDIREGDQADQSSAEWDHTVLAANRERIRLAINEVDQALARIDTGTYGICEDTGRQIGLKRLEARPIATMTIEAQERHEKMEKQYIDEE